MRTFRLSILLGLAAGGLCLAQQWEIGGVAGGGFVPGVGVSNSVGSATAGFQSGFSVGGYFGQNLYRHIGGEIRYEFLQSNLLLKSGGTQATFSGMAHVLHYDLILHKGPRNGRIQYFAALGGGMKLFRGTGQEQAYQPLYQYGFFTKTQAVKPMASVGGGIKFQLRPRVILRTEFRDFITAFPKEVITPPQGTKYGSLLHDFVPLVGISYEY